MNSFNKDAFSRKKKNHNCSLNMIAISQNLKRDTNFTGKIIPVRIDKQEILESGKFQNDKKCRRRVWQPV